MDDAQERRGRLPLVGKGAVLASILQLHVVGLTAPLPLFDEPGTSSSVRKTPSDVHERSSAARNDVAVAEYLTVSGPSR
jgi:hypothetical protein